jgi:hypothetical protein
MMQIKNALVVATSLLWQPATGNRAGLAQTSPGTLDA